MKVAATIETRPSTALAKRIAAEIASTRLLSRGDRIVVALSGGPDSVALLALLSELAPAWNWTVSAFHVDYGLRGAESDGDARFAAVLCDRLAVPFRCEKADLGRDRSSVQARARAVRYELLAREARRVGADKIALGHQADDQAETLLMWMLRGAGTSGLAGIPPVRDGGFVRPLLAVSREELVDYLRIRHLPFRSDSSNDKPLYLRNRIRHELVPLLKRYNPAIVATLRRQAEVLREENHCLEQGGREAFARLTGVEPDGAVAVDRKGLLALPLALQRRVVRSALRQVTGAAKGPTFGSVSVVLDRLARGRSGSVATVAGVRVERAYGRLLFRPDVLPTDCRADLEAAASEGLRCVVPSVVSWPLTGQVIKVGVASGVAPARSGRVAMFDAELIGKELLVRSWRSGDFFHPSGMGGRTKKLQDYFADIKLPRRERKTLPIVTSAGAIVWVSGCRADHRFRVTAETKRVVTVELLEAASEGGAG